MDENTDKYKNLIDNIFEEQILKKQNLSFNSIDDDNISQFCQEKAFEELETVRQAFIEFQNSIQDLAIVPYLVNAIEEFANYAAGLNDTITLREDLEDLDGHTKKKYKVLKRLKAQILSDLYNKYKK